MKHLTLEQAAYSYNDNIGSKDNIIAILENRAFKAGAEWQKEQLLNVLKQIASWPGNLSDEHYLTRTGANDAVARGNMVVAMRSIALDAVRKYEPQYVPFQDYKQS